MKDMQVFLNCFLADSDGSLIMCKTVRLFSRRGRGEEGLKRTIQGLYNVLLGGQQFLLDADG